MATTFLTYMDTANLASPLPEEHGQSIAVELGQLSGMQVYPRSICAAQHSLLFLGGREEKKCLGLISTGPAAGGFSGQSRPVIVADRSSSPPPSAYWLEQRKKSERTMPGSRDQDGFDGNNENVRLHQALGGHHRRNWGARS